MSLHVIPCPFISLGFFIQVVFEAVCGSSFQGDVAIDDVSIVNTYCPTLPARAIPPTVPPTPPMPVNCTFERGICNWKNLKTGDDFDWTRHRGGTYSSYTGPSIDHTTNSNQGNTTSDHKVNIDPAKANKIFRHS